MFDYTDKEFKCALSEIRRYLTNNKVKSSAPTAYILGGQPGAGKSILQRHILSDNKNCVTINADAFRESHPHFLSIQATYGNLAQNYTQPFINKITEQLVKELSDEQYNLIIEGTLRTADVPLNTCKILKSKGYRVDLNIIAVKPEISLESTILRYENARSAGKIPRATTKEHHDNVVNSICTNLDIIYNANLFDDIKLYDRAGNSLYTLKDLCSPSVVASNALYGKWTSNELQQLEKITSEILNLKQARKADDYNDYKLYSEYLLRQIKKNENCFYIKVNPQEAAALTKHNIRFEGKTSKLNEIVIKIALTDKAKALSVLNIKNKHIKK